MQYKHFRVPLVIQQLNVLDGCFCQGDRHYAVVAADINDENVHYFYSVHHHFDISKWWQCLCDGDRHYTVVAADIDFRVI